MTILCCSPPPVIQMPPQALWEGIEEPEAKANKRVRKPVAPTFSPENVITIPTRVQIAPSIHLSLNEPTIAPLYSTAERERAPIHLPPAMSRNADQFEQTQDYKNFIDIQKFVIIFKLLGNVDSIQL